VSTNSTKTIGILGGGIAGLSLGYFLGEESEVLEREDECGGLCRSYQKDGFLYDLGGHIIFSKDTEILNFELELLKDKTNQLYRRNTVWFKGRFVKYPFENGIGVLDKEDIFDLLYNFLENPPRPQKTFEDWIYNTFGTGFADQYLIPYNSKIWKTHPRDMGVHWVERIPKPPAADIIKSALGIETEGYTHQLYFHYPKTGGFQTLPRTFEAHLGSRVVRNFPVKSVRRCQTGWAVSNGNEEREYERIVNAMPIFEFIKVLEGVPEEVKRAVDDLQYNSLVVVMIGLNRPRKVDMTSTYFPQPDLIFHRVVYHDYFGLNYAPEGCSSMVCEITAREDSSLWKMTDKEIAQQAIDGLHREGFLEPNEVMTVDVRRTKYAYAIYDLNREKNLDIIYSWMKQEGIELCGRFAEFVYYNSDAVIRSAKTVSDRMKNEALQHA
jgi:protoporphyrinogen oxidase